MRPQPSRTTTPVRLTCSTCGRRFFIDQSPTPPFCSQRCQMIDLGRWLDESIGLPVEPDPDQPQFEDRDEEG